MLKSYASKIGFSQMEVFYGYGLFRSIIGEITMKVLSPQHQGDQQKIIHF